MAWAIGLTELAGGLLLAAGLWTRAAAAVLAVEMAVAILLVRWPQGFVGAAEFEFVLLLVCLALFGTGSGRISLDAVRGPRRVVFAESLPEDKAAHVRRLQGEGKVVAMVGDGINEWEVRAGGQRFMVVNA